MKMKYANENAVNGLFVSVVWNYGIPIPHKFAIRPDGSVLALVANLAGMKNTEKKRIRGNTFNNEKIDKSLSFINPGAEVQAGDADVIVINDSDPVPAAEEDPEAAHGSQKKWLSERRKTRQRRKNLNADSESTWIFRKNGWKNSF